MFFILQFFIADVIPRWSFQSTLFNDFWEKECQTIVGELQKLVEDQNMTVAEVREYNLNEFKKSNITFDFCAKYALNGHGRHTDAKIICTDGVFYPNQYGISNNYWDFWNYVGTFVAFVCSEFVILIYVYRLLRRMKKLYKQIINPDLKKIESVISVEGSDEISGLGNKIEEMRILLIKSFEEEKKQREEQTKLIASLSHDIRTPLTKIIGCLDILNYGLAKSEEEKTKCIAMITSKAGQLKCLTDRLLNSVTKGNNAIVYQKEICDGPSMFDQLLFEGSYSLEKEGFQVHIPETIPGVYQLNVDVVAIRRVADNVYSNLHKYADKKKPIEIWIEEKKEEVTIYIKNYKTIESSISKQESYGIGLRVIAKIMEAMEGKCEIENQEDTFLIKLTLPFYM